jgi:hypothetical protein
MRRLALALPLAAVLSAFSCGPGRDPTFNRLVQFSAVTKLRIASGQVYFTEAGVFERVPVTGGTVEVITVGGSGVADFAVVDDTGYLATSTGVFKVDLTDITIPAVQLSSEIATAIDADENGVSWLGCNALVSAQPDGSGLLRTTLDPTICLAGAQVALDTSTVYGGDTTGLWYASRSGGAITRITAASCTRMLAGAGWLYCAGASNLVQINPLTGLYQTAVNNSVRDFALSPDRLYGADDTNLFSQARTASTGEEVLGAYADISSVAVDDTSCYFVNTSGSLGLLLSTAL